MGAKFEFIKTALRDYKAVGAITPSSRYVVSRIGKLLPENTHYIIEYGAGDGVITCELLRTLPKEGKLAALEIVPDFINELKEIRDNRLYVLPHDVSEMIKAPLFLNFPRVDAVVSGIPFSHMKRQKRKEIVKNTHSLLRNQGRFILYQTSPLMVPYLKACFKHVRVRLELRNIPPYFLLSAEK